MQPSSRLRVGRRVLAVAVLTVAAILASSVAVPASRGNNSAATITGSFADSCRDFTAHSSKDISHVEIHYAGGRVVKDESTTTPDFAIDGRAGDEIDVVRVKSGRTIETFTCTATSGPPRAVLDVKAPDACFTWDDGLVDCDGRSARTRWAHSTIAAPGHGIVRFFCDWPDDQACLLHEMPCGQLDGYSLCRITYSFRGTASTDPDGDITSWRIDFGDGTSTSGDWATNPPTEVSHEYLIHLCPACIRAPATLTVTDSAGHSDSSAQLAIHQYPD